MGRVMRLNIPTGAGKTITSLLSSLELITQQNKAHLIYTAPLLSILEQNAAEICKFIGDDAAVLEHHSNIVKDDEDEDIVSSRELLAQNWHAPVIVTTLVQLLNTMFDGTTSSIRRFHALGNSVIVIDEVQTVPKKLLTMFDLTISFLSTVCQTTFILCSATQPNLEKAKQPPLVPMSDLMPYQESIWLPFERTRITDGGEMELLEIAEFVEQLLEKHNSLLVVCNKKAEAAELMNLVSASDAALVHLSASMCIAHRKDALQTIKAKLAHHEKVVCIATQVIEAGVDVSFDCVIRMTAGMDSIVQAAGRCNRHGEHHQLAPVYIVRCRGEKLVHLKDIEDGKSATLKLLNDFWRDPDRYGHRLESDAAIQAFYEKLYADMSGNAQDYPVSQTNGKPSDETLYQLLSDNRKRSGNGRISQPTYMTQSFKAAGTAFEVFDSPGTTVIVPWGEGQEIIDGLMDVAVYDYASIKALLQKARAYTVTVYDYQLRALWETGGIMELLDGSTFALGAQYYDETIGLSLPDNRFLEV